jgi:hypothetical protein
VSEGPESQHIFAIDTCEACGKEAEASNAVTLCESVAKAKALGLTELEARLDELYYSDELDKVTCLECHQEAERKAERFSGLRRREDASLQGGTP